MHSGAGTQSLCQRQGGYSISRARRCVGLKGQLRSLTQSAGAHHVELCEFLGLAPTAGGAQQSHQHGLGSLIGRFEETERPRMGQGMIGLALETGY